MAIKDGGEDGMGERQRMRPYIIKRPDRLLCRVKFGDEEVSVLALNRRSPTKWIGLAKNIPTWLGRMKKERPLDYSEHVAAYQDAGVKLEAEQVFATFVEVPLTMVMRARDLGTSLAPQPKYPRRAISPSDLTKICVAWDARQEGLTVEAFA